MPRQNKHVITDLPERPRPIATLGVALPLLGAAALVTGLVLDWHPVSTLIAAIGWPALWWTVRQVRARRKVSADE